ncbi:unnamed protein product [Brachionus calyciflorus]|uniref:Uncharacterized protein n=1 Tax=Brachionus calyciflorus TaxID=104777 RepID=A0A814DMA8_9BILA|nr:unnamed protein product [Brachionus calyciflorus]
MNPTIYSIFISFVFYQITAASLASCPIGCGKGTVMDPKTLLCVLPSSLGSTLGLGEVCDTLDDRCNTNLFCSPSYLKCMETLTEGQTCPSFVGNSVVLCNKQLKNMYCINGVCRKLNQNNCNLVPCAVGYVCDSQSGTCVQNQNEKMCNPANNRQDCDPYRNLDLFCNPYRRVCERYRLAGEACNNDMDFCNQRLGLKCGPKYVCIYN